MRFFRTLFLLLSLILLILTGFLTLLRQQGPQPQWITFETKRELFWRVFQMDSKGQQLSRVNSKSEITQDRLAGWDPNGEWLYFTILGDTHEIYRRHPYGARVTNVTKNPGENWVADISPNGRWILYLSTSETGFYEIYKMRSDGSYPVRLTDTNGYSGSPRWSPDGRQIVFDNVRRGNLEIYMMQSDGSYQLNLTRNTFHDQMPRWSPDGQWILFMSDRDGNKEIYRMCPDGSQVTNLTKNPFDDHLDGWSPDGKYILFTVFTENNAEIYVMKSDGSEQKNLSQNLAIDWKPQWSPDGQWILFESNRNGNREIYKMRPDGSEVTNLTNHSDEDVSPAWSPIINLSWKPEQLLLASFLLLTLVIMSFRFTRA